MSDRARRARAARDRAVAGAAAAREAADARAAAAEARARRAVAVAREAGRPRGDGPAGPRQLAGALRALTRARDADDIPRLSAALAQVAIEARRWRDRL